MEYHKKELQQPNLQQEVSLITNLFQIFSRKKQFCMAFWKTKTTKKGTNLHSGNFQEWGTLPKSLKPRKMTLCKQSDTEKVYSFQFYWMISGHWKIVIPQIFSLNQARLIPSILNYFDFNYHLTSIIRKTNGFWLAECCRRPGGTKSRPLGASRSPFWPAEAPQDGPLIFSGQFHGQI